jgi:hypothetical protein
MSKPRNISSSQRGRDPAAARRARLRTYAKAKKAFLAAHPVCAVCGVRKATELHHRAGRVGKLLLADWLYLPACATCHRWLHAKARGWIVGPWNTMPK